MNVKREPGNPGIFIGGGITKNALINLLKVKSLVTVILTLVFAYLAIVNVITGDQFLSIFEIVIAFYFGTQTQKIADAAAAAESEEEDGTEN